MRAFNLDMIPGGAQTAVACNQYESGDVWLFSLYYDGGRYSIPADAEVSITGTKPDGAAYKVAGTVTDNAVVIEVTEQMTACAGRSIAEILVESETDGTTLYSANFPLLVEPAAVQGEFNPSEIPSAIVDTDGNVYYSAQNVPGISAGVPSEVRQAMLALFEKAVYTEPDLADEVAVVQAWAEATTGVTVSPATVSLSSASPMVQLSAVTTPAGKAVTWASSNTSVATVSSNGLVTGVGNGVATITATSGAVSASCAVTVSNYVITHTITNTLSNCTNSNTDTSTEEGASYSGTITADSGCYVDDTDITVTMGGTDVTSTVLSNNVITIASVTGDVVITATAVEALYPLKNGTHTFSNGDSVTITGHKHVEINLVSRTQRWIDISDISENTTTSTTADNVKNQPKKFTIPAGSTAVYTIENLAIPMDKISFNAYGLGTSGALDMAISNVTSGGPYTATLTPSGDTDCGCLFAVPYGQGKTTFDVSFTVDGVKYV